jgi:hypothetical protein
MFPLSPYVLTHKISLALDFNLVDDHSSQSLKHNHDVMFVVHKDTISNMGKIHPKVHVQYF